MAMLFPGPILVTMALSCSATARRRRLLAFSSHHTSPWTFCGGLYWCYWYCFGVQPTQPTLRSPWAVSSVPQSKGHLKWPSRARSIQEQHDFPAPRAKQFLLALELWRTLDHIGGLVDRGGPRTRCAPQEKQRQRTHRIENPGTSWSPPS